MHNLLATVDKSILRSSFRGLCIEVAGGSPITSPAKDRANWDTSDSRALSTTADSHIVQGGPGDVPTAGQPTAQGTMAAVCVA